MDLFEQKNIELNNKLYKIEWESHNKILQLETDKAELQKALIKDINTDCYKYCLQFNSKYECNINSCGLCKERIQLLEKQTGKSWEEIKDDK